VKVDVFAQFAAAVENLLLFPRLQLDTHTHTPDSQQSTENENTNEKQ